MLRLFFFLVHFTPPFGIIFLFLFFCPVLESPKPENGKNGNANGLREFGVTAGFGFPVPSFRTIVNLGFEFKHRAANPDPLIKENYFNITIGVNFNEMWFRQSKIY